MKQPGSELREGAGWRSLGRRTLSRTARASSATSARPAHRSLERRAKEMARAVRSVRYFSRGYRYGRRLPPPAVPIPANATGTVNALEAYFDAHVEGPGIWKWRHYFEIYDCHLSRFRGQPVHVVEVGVLGGGSLQMWREYLGPEIRISGIDIDPACRELACEGVEIFVGDQGDPAFWARFLENSPAIDVVIDDGGHTPYQQTVTLECLLPHIRPGGVYICEDIHGRFQPFHSFVDGLTHLLSDIGPEHEYNPASTLHQQIASIHRYPILTVIEKAAVCAPVFSAALRGTEWPARPGRWSANGGARQADR
jgi:hypothetical protein